MADTYFQTGGFMAPVYPPASSRSSTFTTGLGPGQFTVGVNSGGAGSVGGPAVGLADYPAVYNMLNSLQQGANLGRIPGEPGLEAQSSADIAGLLNPGTSFPDVNRQSAELAAGRGVPGSAAAYGTGLRMTDEERLRRIALGENLLSGATARNPSAPLPNVRDFVLTPYEQAQLALEQQRLGAGGYGRGGGGPTVTYGGGLPSYAPASPALPGGYPAPVAYSGTGEYTPNTSTLGTYPNPSGDLLPLYPGGDVTGGQFDWNDALDQLGLGDFGDGSGTGDFGLGDFSGGGDFGGYA